MGSKRLRVLMVGPLRQGQVIGGITSFLDALIHAPVHPFDLQICDTGGSHSAWKSYKVFFKSGSKGMRN